MKKLALALSLILASTSALAHGGWGGHGGGGYRGGYNHYENHYHGGGGGGFVGPALIGGIIGYGIAQPRYYPEPQVIYQQPQVIYQQPQSVYQNCTAWIESVDQYGQVTRTRTCY
jgi:hypothetical protein